MISGKTQIAAAAAVLALSATVSAAPSSQSYLEARGPGFSKVAKVGGDAAMDIAHRKAVAAANNKINDHLGLNKPHVPQGLADAAKAHQDALAHHGAAVLSHGNKKRDLENALEELIARSGIVNRVTGKVVEAGLDIAHRKVVGAANDKINSHIGKPQVPQGLVDAAKAHDKALANHGAAVLKGQKKRELQDELEELIAREFENELNEIVARGPGMSKVAKHGTDVALDVAHRHAVNAANNKINEHTGLNKPHVPQGLADAAKAHQDALAHHGAAVLSHGKKKRNLEDALEELMARGPGMSKVAKHGTDVALDIAHRHAVNAANNKINEHTGLNKPHVPQGLVDAAKAHQDALAHHGAAVVSHGKKKRDLGDVLEELMARGPGMSRVAKHGTDVALDIAHRHAVNAANDKINEHTGLNKPHVPQGLADAAKAHQDALAHHGAAVLSHGKKKRDLDNVLEELMARGPGMSKVAKHGTDVALDIAHRHAVNAANDKINEHTGLNRPHVPQGLVDAAKAHQDALAHHGAAVVSHGKKKRDLDALIEYLEARDFELEDLE